MRGTKNTWFTWPLLSIGLMAMSMAARGATPQEIWRDDFNRSPSVSVGNGWIESEANESDASIGISDERSALKLSNDNTYVTRMIPITGYSDVQINWEVRGSSAQKMFDVVRMHITKDGGATWDYRLTVYPVYYTASWPGYSTSISLSPDYYVPGFGIRLSLDLDLLSSSGSPDPADRDAFVDYVFLTGIPSGDTVPPLVTNVAATPDPQTFDGDVLISADVTDNTGIASVEYALDGVSWTAMTLDSGTTYTATLVAPFVGDYSVCVRGTDTASPANTSDGTACGTFDVAAAQLGIAFAGQELDLDGAPTQLKAEVAGPCSSGAEVEFFVDGVSQGTAITDTLGVASLSKTLQMGVHDIRAEVDDQDLGGDSEPECKGDSDAGVSVMADPNAASSGGGWYKVDGVTPPRVNFGYVANVKYNKKTQEFATAGNLLWMNQDNFKLKGAINQSGKFDCPTSDYVRCAAFAGTGILYEHNGDYDPAIDPPSEEWAGNSPLEVSFVATVYDGGSSTVCQKKRCTVTERPDAIMMQINGASVPAAPYEIITLQGGSITVKK